MVRVEFDYVPQDNDPHSPRAEGWVAYDPARSWVIREYDLHTKWSSFNGEATSAGSIEYDESDPSFPIPKFIKDHYKNINVKFELQNEITFVSKESSLPESQFTLSAYGFPEPNRRHPALWFLYAMAAGLACLALSAWLRRKSRDARPA